MFMVFERGVILFIMCKRVTMLNNFSILHFMTMTVNG
jgi:hypothetical protein